MLDINKEAARCLLCADGVCDKACKNGYKPAEMIRSVFFENSENAASESRYYRMQFQLSANVRQGAWLRCRTKPGACGAVHGGGKKRHTLAGACKNDA